MERIQRKAETRIWCDGCYDFVHFGHVNSFRQAKAFGSYLIVGVHSDDDIVKHKGLPVYTLKERSKMLKSIKWIDEVIENVPYITTLEVLDKYNCDICCHGNDITCTSDGIDTYFEIKNSGKYREIERTAGISTTGLVKRVLQSVEDEQTTQKLPLEETALSSPWTGSTFLLTTKKLIEFASLNNQIPKENDRIVYVAGTFDLYHIGHVAFLEKAKTLGDYLIVGIYTDRVVKERNGKYPIMCLEERVMNILGCKYVSEVILGAPYIVTKDLIEHFRVDVVAVGNFRWENRIDDFDPYKYPKQLKKFIIVDSGCDVTTDEIVQRIVKNRKEFEKRNTIKEEKELKLIKSRI